MRAFVIDVDWETIVIRAGNKVTALKAIGKHATRVGDELSGEFDENGLATFLNKSTNLVLVSRVDDFNRPDEDSSYVHHQASVPGSPLNGPMISGVTQPP